MRLRHAAIAIGPVIVFIGAAIDYAASLCVEKRERERHRNKRKEKVIASGRERKRRRN